MPCYPMERGTLFSTMSWWGTTSEHLFLFYDSLCISDLACVAKSDNGD